MTNTPRAAQRQGAVVPPDHVRPGPPHPPSALVPRLRLVDRVEEGVAKGMVVVSGPAGAGKTMLLASWAERRRPAAAWLSVEPEDADPAQFWIRVLAALQASPAVAPTSSLGTLRPPPGPDRRFVARLLRACDEQPEPLALVLDDLHQLIGTPSMTTLAEATRRGLGNLHLVISTRADPPLPLQRLRLDDRLTELRAADLAFDRSEAALLLTQHDLHLEPGQLDSLLASTEGWAAGVRLAALSLHDKDDLDQALAELAGNHRTVADYFTEEVLGRLSPADVTVPAAHLAAPPDLRRPRQHPHRPRRLPAGARAARAGEPLRRGARRPAQLVPLPPPVRGPAASPARDRGSDRPGGAAPARRGLVRRARRPRRVRPAPRRRGRLAGACAVHDPRRGSQDPRRGTPRPGGPARPDAPRPGAERSGGGDRGGGGRLRPVRRTVGARPRRAGP